MKVFFQETISEDSAVPGAVIAIQSFGDFLGFNPHLHVLCTDACFYGDGVFRVAPRFETNGLEEIFRHKVFKMLLSKGKITEDLVNMLMNWRHSGFNVFCGPRIQPREESAMENLARYIIRASFSLLPVLDNLSRASRSNECLYVDPEYPEAYSFDLEALDRPA